MNKKNALVIMSSILIVLLIFHLLILLQIIPYNQVWAGRLSSVEEMRRFEAFSIALNIFMLSILIIKHRQLTNGNSNKIINSLIWLFSAFFLLNTLGNLFAKNTLELILGTTLTLISSLLCFYIVKKDKK